MGKERIALLMETICATGIRVSEVKYITAEECPGEQVPQVMREHLGRGDSAVQRLACTL